jgi:hypothetical protein
MYGKTTSFTILQSSQTKNGMPLIVKLDEEKETVMDINPY